MTIILMNGKNDGENLMMMMAKKLPPEFMQLFENLLWANSPKDWILKSTYFKETLFVSMIIETNDDEPCQKIRRSFLTKDIHDRKEYLYGLASDCVDEMKAEIKS